MKRWSPTLALVCLLGLALLPARSAHAGRPHLVPFSVLLVALGSEPSTLDPAQDAGTGSTEYYGSAYEGLTAYVGSTTQIGPMLARSWTTSGDHRVYTFSLQPHVVFADGSPFNAAAVAYNIRRMQHINQGYDYLVGDVERIDVLGPLTVRMTLSHPDPFFLAALAFGHGTGMVSEAGARAHQAAGDWGATWYSSHTDGTGPYQLAAWTHNEQSTWLMNPHYWRGWSGEHLDEVIFRFVKDAALQKKLLQQANADVLLGALTPGEAIAMAGQAGVTVHATRALDVYYLGLNTTQKPLNDYRVRQALAYAIDYTAIIKAEAGTWIAQPYGFAPASMLPGEAGAPQYHFDLNRARSLLAAAGYPHGGFTLQAIWTSGAETHTPVERIVRADLAKLGIHLVEQPVPMATAVNPGQEGLPYQIWDTDWVPPVDDLSGYYVGILACSTRGSHGSNWSYYCNPAFDRLVQQGIAAPAGQQRAASYAAANRILLHDMPMIPVYQSEEVIPMRSMVQGYVFNPVNAINLNYYGIRK